MLQLTCRISTLGKWIALQPPTYTSLLRTKQVERGAVRVEGALRRALERTVVQILIEVAISRLLPATDEEKDSAATKTDCGSLGPKRSATATQASTGKRVNIPAGPFDSGNARCCAWFFGSRDLIIVQV